MPSALRGVASKLRRGKKAEIFAAWDNLCVYCGAAPTTLDHFVPRSAGGKPKEENLVPACEPCNIVKGNQHPLEFLSNDPQRFKMILRGLMKFQGLGFLGQAPAPSGQQPVVAQVGEPGLEQRHEVGEPGAVLVDGDDHVPAGLRRA